MTATFVAGAGNQNVNTGLRGIKVRLQAAAKRAADDAARAERQRLADIEDRPFAAENWDEFVYAGDYHDEAFSKAENWDEFVYAGEADGVSGTPPTMLQEYPAAQIAASWMLARAHGHTWAQPGAVERKHLSEAMTPAKIAGLAQSYDEKGIHGPGRADKRGYLWHQTCTGRTIWRVAPNGDVTVWLFDARHAREGDARLSRAQFTYEIKWGGAMGGVVQSVGKIPGKGPAGSAVESWPCAERWNDACISNVFGPFGWAKRTA